MSLSERCKHFIEEVGVPVTVMCRKVNLSTRSLYYWFNGKLRLSDAALQRIDEYLKQFGF